METNSIQQEILLMTGTTFSQMPWSKKDDADNTSHLTDKEQLEEACWNGLLHDMLPEICEYAVDGKKLYLWQVREAASFLEIEMGEIPAEKESYFSIDPYSFMPAKSYN